VQKNIFTIFGNRIRELRQKQGLSQERLAEIAGFDRTYISLIERGKREPRLSNIKKFADAFGISLSELFEEN
jgi:transcriptional regulator with XRE-family HTH domain